MSVSESEVERTTTGIPLAGVSFFISLKTSSPLFLGRLRSSIIISKFISLSLKRMSVASTPSLALTIIQPGSNPLKISFISLDSADYPLYQKYSGICLFHPHYGALLQ